MLRSQHPEWFNLYSGKKFLLLICCFLASLGAFWFSRRIKVPEKAFWLWNRLSESPRITLVATALLSSILYLGKGMSVGEDIGGQVKSSLQWHDGIVDHPNFVAQPKWSNLSEDQTSWGFRPPGASWLPLPGLSVGLSLGSSLGAGLFLCVLSGGFGWIKFCEKLKLSKSGLCFLAIIIGLSAGPESSFYSTANIILFALVPWFIVWAMSIGSLCDSQNDHPHWGKLTINTATFLFLLGCFAWIKLSGMIVAGTIAALPLVSFLLGKRKFSKNLRLVVLYLLVGSFFWIPFLTIERVNRDLSGLTANEFYGAYDSNLEAHLVGKHFGESTRGGWLAWSALGGPGYALPAKQISHGFRDLMIQFEQVKSWLDQNEINEHVIFGGLLSIGCTILLLFVFKSIWSLTLPQLRLAYACFLFLPFIGLGILSFKYGFNYLLYPAHTIEYHLIFTVPALFILSLPNVFSRISSQLFLGICIALPITTQIEGLSSIPFHQIHYTGSPTEQARGFEAREFSNAIRIIEQDSKNHSDILLFLPTGDMGDLVLRTKLRTLAIHFAGDSLAKYGTCRTSQPITVYCAYSASLRDNKSFQEALKDAFPQATKIYELTQPEANDAVAIRITLEPSQKGSS
ncbi:hypothetical protein OAK38_03095 [Verrucomicrobia bacterium]|nr:hypothetical protein [Verrucomicrobiota bacterium]